MYRVLHKRMYSLNCYKDALILFKSTLLGQ